MQTLSQRVFLLAPPGGVFDDAVVRNLFPGTTDGARRQLVLRAVRHGEVLRLKPGLYCLAQPYARAHPHPFVVAGLMHSPSHVSCESSLAHHGLIPEAVRQVVSVTVRRSRTFDTPLGFFAFEHVPTADPLAGVQAERLGETGWALIARPVRAIADLIYLRRDVSWQRDGAAFLSSSLRLEPEDVQALAADDLKAVAAAFRSRRVRRYLEGLREEVTA